MATGGRPSGWYQDPSGRPNSLRWWDGSTWTEDYRSTSDFVRSSSVSPPTPLTPPPAEYSGEAAGAAQPTVSASAFPPGAGAQSGDPFGAASRPPVVPVQFEAVEPNRTKRRIVWTVIGVVLAAAAGIGGYIAGTSGDKDKAETTSSSSSAPHVNVPNLAGWWKLADGSGQSAADATGRQQAGAAGVVEWSPDKGGSAVFSGNGSLATSKAVVDTTKSFTVSAWAKLGDLSGNNTVVAQDGNSVSGFYLHFNKTAGTWAFVRTSEDTASPSGWYTALATAPAQKDTWTQLTGVYDATTGQITLYVNGQAQKSAAAPQTWNATGPLTIGRAKSNADLFHGSIADVEVFDRVLTPAEIQSLATNPGLAKK
ncbi:MAG: DUF2510 domain-containing protein [Streptomycetaceae bacterium]|jgi:hypothetical protein|nr:DUF2510 domain-containing protein [Streptomycetaceae bacterium]